MHDPLHPAGKRFERVEFQDLRHRGRQREGGEREINPLQPQRRQPEQEPDDKAHRARGRQCRVIRHVPAVHQDRRGVGADAVKRAVPERELAVEPGQQVEAEDRQAVDHHQGQLEHAQSRARTAAPAAPRSHARRSQPCCVAAATARRVRRGLGRVERDRALPAIRAARHTRVTTRRPKMPLGRTISTATISTSAIVSFSSRPT